MEKAQIIMKLLELCSERLFLEDVDIDKSLVDDYGLDSVSVFELIIGLEDKFDIDLEEVAFDFGKFQTVRTIANFVLDLREDQHPKNGRRK